MSNNNFTSKEFNKTIPNKANEFTPNIFSHSTNLNPSIEIMKTIQQLGNINSYNILSSLDQGILDGSIFDRNISLANNPFTKASNLLTPKQISTTKSNELTNNFTINNNSSTQHYTQTNQSYTKQQSNDPYDFFEPTKNNNTNILSNEKSNQIHLTPKFKSAEDQLPLNNLNQYNHYNNNDQTMTNNCSFGKMTNCSNNNGSLPLDKQNGATIQNDISSFDYRNIFKKVDNKIDTNKSLNVNNQLDSSSNIMNDSVFSFRVSKDINTTDNNNSTLCKPFEPNVNNTLSTNPFNLLLPSYSYQSNIHHDQFNQSYIPQYPSIISMPNFYYPVNINDTSSLNRRTKINMTIEEIEAQLIQQIAISEKHSTEQTVVKEILPNYYQYSPWKTEDNDLPYSYNYHYNRSHYNQSKSKQIASRIKKEKKLFIKELFAQKAQQETVKKNINSIKKENNTNTNDKSLNEYVLTIQIDFPIKVTHTMNVLKYLNMKEIIELLVKKFNEKAVVLEINNLIMKINDRLIEIDNEKVELSNYVSGINQLSKKVLMKGLVNNKEIIKKDYHPKCTSYITIPLKEELNSMTKKQLKHVLNFTISNSKGKLRFKSECDLTYLNIDNIIIGYCSIKLNNIHHKLRQKCTVEFYNILIDESSIYQMNEQREICFKNFQSDDFEYNKAKESLTVQIDLAKL